MEEDSDQQPPGDCLSTKTRFRSRTAREKAPSGVVKSFNDLSKKSGWGGPLTDLEETLRGEYDDRAHAEMPGQQLVHHGAPITRRARSRLHNGLRSTREDHAASERETERKKESFLWRCGSIARRRRGHAAQARAANPSANQGQQDTGVGIDKIDLIVPVVTALVIGIYMGATGGDRPGWMTATPY